MKLIKGSKQFVRRDPKKAHLFYLPFSSQRLRQAFNQETFASKKDLEDYLKNYKYIILLQGEFSSGFEWILVNINAPNETVERKAVWNEL